MKLAPDDWQVVNNAAAFFSEGELPYDVTPQVAHAKLSAAIVAFDKYQQAWAVPALQYLKRCRETLAMMEDKPAYDQIQMMGIQASLALVANA